MQIEEQEIDDVTVQEAIGEVAENAGEKQPEGERDATDRAVRVRKSSTVTTTSATQESAMKNPLLFRNEPKAAPVFVTWTRLKKSGMIVRGSYRIDEAEDEIFGHLVEQRRAGG